MKLNLRYWKKTPNTLCTFCSDPNKQVSEVLPLTIPGGFPQSRRSLSTQCNACGKQTNRVTIKVLLDWLWRLWTNGNSGRRNRQLEAIPRTPTCILRRSWAVQRVWAILLFPEESRLWHWGLMAAWKHCMLKLTTERQEVEPSKDEHMIEIEPEWWLTVFELFTHDGACWRGYIVCGVLLRVGRCDDGHQVVPVWWVDLETSKPCSRHWNQWTHSTSNNNHVFLLQRARNKIT